MWNVYIAVCASNSIQHMFTIEFCSPGYLLFILSLKAQIVHLCSSSRLGLSVRYLQGVHFLSMLFVFISVYQCPTRYSYQMMFSSFTITRQVIHVDQELLIPSSPRFLEGFVLYGLQFSVSCFVDQCLCLFAIVLSILLQFTASDYPFGNFKLVFHYSNAVHQV